MTQGFWAADLRIKVDDEQVEDWPIEQRAAYFARRGMVELGQKDHAKVVDLIGKIKAIWDKWEADERRQPAPGPRQGRSAARL